MNEKTKRQINFHRSQYMFHAEDRIKIIYLPFALFSMTVSTVQYTTGQQEKNNEQPGKAEEFSE